MMDTDHTVTPPPELVERLQDLEPLEAIRFAYRAGADWELGGCEGWLTTMAMTRCWNTVAELASELRDARRPKPSLKRQALQALKHAEEGWRPVPEDCALIRRALEALPD